MSDSKDRSNRTVLLVEDNPDDAALLAIQLAEAPGGEVFTVQHVQSLDGALSVLWSSSADVVLLDLALPDSFGLGTLELLLGAQPAVPVVILTGLADDQAAVQAVALGAQDYVVKGASGPDLVRVLNQAIVRTLHEHPDQADQSSAFRAMHDASTQLPNRYLFEDRLQQAVARARRYRESLGLLVLRVWSMPWLGEELHPDSRTAVIYETARRLKAGTRRSDTLARLDEDTFALVLERPGTREALQEHLSALVGRLEAPISWRTSRVSVRVQPGLAFCPEDAGDSETLLAAAVTDGAMLR
ncbi:MAG: diguanylate cyclase [Gemmatimonadales bacterium]